MLQMINTQKIIKVLPKLVWILFFITILWHLLRFLMVTKFAEDFILYKQAGLMLIQNINPYSIQFQLANYPPGFFYISTLIILIFGASEQGFLLGLMICTWLNGILLFFFTKKFVIQSNSLADMIIPNNCGKEFRPFIPWFVMLFYLNDLSVAEYIYGYNEILAVIFFVIGFYYFIFDRYVISAVFWGISVSIELIPLFLIPLLFYYFYRKKELNYFFGYIAIFSLIFIVFALPFLINDFNATLYGFMQVASRPSYDFRFTEANPDLDSFLYQKLVKIEWIPFSRWFLIQILAYCVLVFSIIQKNLIQFTKRRFIISTIIIYLFLPLFTNTYGQRFITWIVPILYIFVLITKNPKMILWLWILIIGSILYYPRRIFLGMVENGIILSPTQYLLYNLTAFFAFCICATVIIFLSRFFFHQFSENKR